MKRAMIVLALLGLGGECLAAEKPSIIYIMADDLGYADLGCYGQKEIQTPNIDRLAAEGKRFTDFYSGCTVCAPARSTLMTGQHMGHTWIRGNFGKVPDARIPLRDEDVTVAEVLKAAGYTTGMTGKWGLGEPETEGLPNRQGFDFWFGYLNQRNAHSYYPPYLWRNTEKYPLLGNADGRRQQYSHHYIANEALDFVRRSKDKPFFLYVPFCIPHGDYEIPSDRPYSDKPWPTRLKNYAAMVTLMDRDVGRLMKLLKDLDIDHKTLVFFCSDNGPAFVEEVFDSNGPLRGFKRDLYEGGIRVPMIARWPGHIEAGMTSDQVWCMYDFLPTAAELAGARAPENIDGISMANALLGRPQKNHTFLYWEFDLGGTFHQAVRHGNYKAVRRNFGPLELYNLSEDIGESRDIAAGHPDIVGLIEDYLKTARSDSEHWPVTAKAEG